MFDSKLTITMKSIVHHVKHVGLRSVQCVLCTISAFWTVADVYSADSVSQIVNFEGNEYLTSLFGRVFSYNLIRKWKRAVLLAIFIFIFMFYKVV